MHGAGDPRQADGSFRFLQRLDCTQPLAPVMPDPDHPDAGAWAEAITDEINKLDDGAVIVTHSLGGSCALAALAAMPQPPVLSALILVAAPHWGKDPDWSAASFVLPTDYAQRIRSIAPIHLVYSADDEVVPLTHMRYYAEELTWAQQHVLHGVDHTFIHGSIDVVQRLIQQ